MSPALPPVGQVVACRVIGTDVNDIDVGTHFDIHYASTAPNTGELNTFAGAIASAWVAELAALTPDDFTLKTIDCVDLSTASSPTGQWTGSDAGTRGATTLPLSTAFTLQYHTALRRRGGHWHGQWRFGVNGDLQNAQTWTSSFVSATLSNWNTFISSVLSAGWSGSGTLTHVGVQYYGPPNRTITGSTGRVRTVSTILVTPEVWPVTGYGAFTRLGSQRRRLGKSGT